MAKRFKGLSAFPITPADEAGQVDSQAFSALVERLDAAEVDSIGILGSTGTYMYLSRAERRRAIEAAAAVLKGRRTLMAGVGALRTDEAVALAKDAQAAGADALLLAPVSYTPLTQEEAYHHFAAVAGATGLPLAIYNNPTTTRFSFSDELLVRLAYIPNIRAIKMPLPADRTMRASLRGCGRNCRTISPSVTAETGDAPRRRLPEVMPGTASLRACCRSRLCG